MKSLAFGLASALLLSATASAQELKTYNPYFDPSIMGATGVDTGVDLTEALKINYANCVMKHMSSNIINQGGGTFLDSDAALLNCNCIAITIQKGESQEQCNNAYANPQRITRPQAFDAGLTKY